MDNILQSVFLVFTSD
uniref:Uncharacterized protein n=1 Tax=Arundo donax TaxID=35708 RepID=A0A0A8ZUK2_ARUDO